MGGSQKITPIAPVVFNVSLSTRAARNPSLRAQSHLEMITAKAEFGEHTSDGFFCYAHRIPSGSPARHHWDDPPVPGILKKMMVTRKKCYGNKKMWSNIMDLIVHGLSSINCCLPHPHSFWLGMRRAIIHHHEYPKS